MSQSPELGFEDEEVIVQPQPAVALTPDDDDDDQQAADSAPDSYLRATSTSPSPVDGVHRQPRLSRHEPVQALGRRTGYCSRVDPRDY